MILVCYIALNPISAENHQIMADYLMINFNETCYIVLWTSQKINLQFMINLLVILIAIHSKFFLDTY